MRNHRKLIVAGGLGLAVLTFQHPTADFRILTHDTRDPSPRQVKAALDLGLMAVSVLVTWTGQRIAD
ncbi:MAG TPA: hypothetical protein VF592_08045 [Sphingomonas sp.]|jgi:hypothetical protein|uniref:hypothetical protein n=1 Tax=Sphingomonas sp. TaxID=28214 RepID=UPI002ED916B2